MIFGILYDIINPSVVIIISGFILMIAIALYKKTLLSYDERELESEFEA
mgnify:FL=1